MTDRLPLLVCFGSSAFDDPREFFSTWGGHLTGSVMPGLLLVATFLLRPHDFVALGPTAVTLTLLAMLFVVALPLHTYRQFLGLKDEDPIIDCSANTFQSGKVFQEGDRSRGTTPRREKTEWLGALEETLLRRTGSRAPWKDPGRRVKGPKALEMDRLSTEHRDRLERAYADLHLDPGVGLAEVRRSYRKHMAVFHPDRHENDGVNHALAVELTRRLATAYSIIVSALRR